MTCSTFQGYGVKPDGKAARMVTREWSEANGRREIRGILLRLTVRRARSGSGLLTAPRSVLRIPEPISPISGAARDPDVRLGRHRAVRHLLGRFARRARLLLPEPRGAPGDSRRRRGSARRRVHRLLGLGRQEEPRQVRHVLRLRRREYPRVRRVRSGSLALRSEYQGHEERRAGELGRDPGEVQARARRQDRHLRRGRHRQEIRDSTRT